MVKLRKLAWCIGFAWALSMVFFCASATVKAGPFEDTGYVQFYFFPDHNEHDPNPGVDFKDRTVARYGIDFFTDIALSSHPKWHAFGEAFTLFGNGHPQHAYNYSAATIVSILYWGGGYRFRSNVDFGIESSRHVGLSYRYAGEGLICTGLYTRLSW